MHRLNLSATKGCHRGSFKLLICCQACKSNQIFSIPSSTQAKVITKMISKRKCRFKKTMMMKLRNESKPPLSSANECNFLRSSRVNKITRVQIKDSTTKPSGSHETQAFFLKQSQSPSLQSKGRRWSGEGLAKIQQE